MPYDLRALILVTYAACIITHYDFFCIQIQAVDQSLPVVLLINLYKLVLFFASVDDLRKYVPMVLFLMQYKVILTFGSVDKMLRCSNSNESY